MKEQQVQAFWEQYPCGDFMVGRLDSYKENYEEFFRDFDNYRQRTEGHIAKCLQEINFSGKKTLEIGLGQGTEAEQIIRMGAQYSGVDLTEESIRRVNVRFQLRNLVFDVLQQGSVLDLPFEDNSFDIVFSHGVLHHVPEIHQAQKEIHRVLKPDGKLVVMLYAKWSVNYLIAISIFRRLGLMTLYALDHDPGGIYSQHLANAKEVGLLKYLKMNNFIHRNTDGPLNPYSKVYSRKSVEQDFTKFKIGKIYKRHMHAPPLPVKWLPLGNLLGWHLWVEMSPRQTTKSS